MCLFCRTSFVLVSFRIWKISAWHLESETKKQKMEKRIFTNKILQAVTFATDHPELDIRTRTRKVKLTCSTSDSSFHFSIITSKIQATLIQPALHLGRYRHPSTLWAACRSGLLDFDFGGGCFNGTPTPIHFAHFVTPWRLAKRIFPWQTLRMYTLKLPRKNRSQWYYCMSTVSKKCQRWNAFLTVFNTDWIFSVDSQHQPCTMKGKH